MSIIENILKTVILDEAVIIDKEALSKTVFKIRLQSDSLKKTDFAPGATLRMGIGIGKEALSMKNKMRTYSVWDSNKSEGYLDLAIATHSHGIGADWAKESQVGDRIYFKTKKGNFLADDTADSYVMIGDLSALSHLYMINRNIGQNKQLASIIYSQEKSDFFPDTNGSSPFDFYTLPDNPTNGIIAKLKGITPTLKGKKMVYIAGDSRVCLALHHFFKNELQWETKQIKTKPFWNPDKIGLE